MARICRTKSRREDPLERIAFIVSRKAPEDRAGPSIELPFNPAQHHQRIRKFKMRIRRRLSVKCLQN
jgi:hypothetical protein